MLDQSQQTPGSNLIVVKDNRPHVRRRRGSFNLDARTKVRASLVVRVSVKLLFLLFLVTLFFLLALVLLFFFFLFRHLYDSFHVLNERPTICLVYGRSATSNFTRFASAAPLSWLVLRLLLNRCG